MTNDDSRPPLTTWAVYDAEAQDDILTVRKTAYDALAKELAEAKDEVERHKAIENGLLDEIKIMQDGIDNWGKMYREAIKWGDSQSALISKYASMLERCEDALDAILSMNTVSDHMKVHAIRKLANEFKAEIAAFKKGEK